MDPNLPPAEPADRTPAAPPAIAARSAGRYDASPAELRATYFPEAPAKPALVRMPPAMFRLLMIMVGFCLWFGAATIIQPRQSTATPGGGRAGSSAVMPSLPAADRPWERRFAERADGWSGQEPGGMTPDDTAALRAAGPAGAGAAAAGSTPAALTPPAKDADGRKLLGSLVGSAWHIWIYSDASGPLYTIVDPQGRIQAQGLTADDVYRQFPDLPIDRLRLVPGPDALMLAEPMR